VDFLLGIIELFSLGITSKVLRAKSRRFWRGVGQLSPTFHVEGVISHQPFFASENYASSFYMV